VKAANITRQSKSNLALAFISLGRERKRDINIFYAFCRVVDDIADSSKLNVAEKRQRLAAWREMLRSAIPGEPALAHEVRCLIDKYSLSIEMLEEIISGVEMDLSISRYATFEELRVYCYRVASVVGLVSIEIFGYRNPACKGYALQLGLALQITNIIRDIGKDLRNGRIYLPHEDLKRFSVRVEHLKADRQSPEFIALMRFEAARARAYYEAAQPLLGMVHKRSRSSLWALIEVYSRLLKKIEASHFDVLSRRIALSTAEKCWVVLRAVIR